MGRQSGFNPTWKSPDSLATAALSGKENKQTEPGPAKQIFVDPAAKAGTNPNSPRFGKGPDVHFMGPTIALLLM